MSIHPNSREAFLELLHSGKLSKRRKAVATAVLYNPGSTANEIWKVMNNEEGTLQDSVTPRFIELEEQGVIVRGATRICKTTKRSAVTWSINPDVLTHGVQPYKPKIGRAPQVKRVTNMAEYSKALMDGEQLIFRRTGWQGWPIPDQTTNENYHWDYLKNFEIFRFRLPETQS